MRVVECVPNFSEGRKKETVDELSEEIARSGVKILDVEMDPDHNRSVITFVGELEKVKEGAFFGVKRAKELIDLNAHKGRHPRIGACDVVPLVPINCKIEDCIDAARDLGKKIWEELGIPVYFYEEAALRPERRRLETIRRGGFERLREEAERAERRPDLGDRIHPTAGAVAVGARRPLIAYNVYLKDGDEELAKRIAREIRESSGGLKKVKAIGLMCGGRPQVSMNLVDFEVTPIHRVLEEIEKYGKIDESELVGLIPERALLSSSYHYLKLRIGEERILEKRLESLLYYKRVYDLMDEVASKKPVPSGGSVAALTGALACSLMEKAYTISGLNGGKISHLRGELLSLVQEDSFEAKAGEKEVKGAALPHLKTMELCQEAEKLCKKLIEKCDERVRSEARCALELAQAGAKCARMNVEAKLEAMTDEKFVKEVRRRLK
jgi:glutamate formiminotransferase